MYVPAVGTKRVGSGSPSTLRDLKRGTRALNFFIDFFDQVVRDTLANIGIRPDGITSAYRYCLATLHAPDERAGAFFQKLCINGAGRRSSKEVSISIAWRSYPRAFSRSGSIRLHNETSQSLLPRK